MPCSTLPSDADGAAWADLIATRPADMPGAVRLLRYVSDSPASEVVDDPQDLLRQLAAAVEAVEAGGEQGDGAAAAGGTAVAAEPDPALAVVAEFQASWDALAAAIEEASGVGVPDVDPAIEDREGHAYERLKTVRPTTPEGFRALANAWAMVLGGERGGEPGLQHADHAADSLIAGAGVCAPLEAVEPTRDLQAYAAMHPGFVPFPAHDPTMLLALDLAIRGEAKRFLGLAQAEIERLRPAHASNPDPSVWLRVERSLRREMRMDALSLVVADLPDDDRVPDPVLAVIAASRDAEAEMAAFQSSLDGPMTPKLRAREDTLFKVQSQTRDAVWATVPTTHAGRLALVDYARFQIEVDTGPNGHVGSPEDLLTEILKALGAAIAAERPEVVSPADAALIDLGAEFMAAWVEEARAGTSAAYNAASAVAARIAVAPAETVAGYGIKALVLARLFSEGSSPLAPETVPARGPVYSVWRMLRQVQQGAARLAGVDVEAEAPDAGTSDTLEDRILATWAACAAAEEASDDDASEALLERRSALIRETERLPATRQHLVAKALALAWIEYADHHEERLTREDHAIDGRLALDIQAAIRGAAVEEHPDAALLAIEPELVALLAAREAVRGQERSAEATLAACAGPEPVRPKRGAFMNNAEYDAARRRFEVQREAWGRTWARVSEHLRYRQLEEVYAEADTALLNRARTLAEMPARTLTGLLMKARWVRDGADEELKESLVADLLAMGSGV